MAADDGGTGTIVGAWIGRPVNRKTLLLPGPSSMQADMLAPRKYASMIWMHSHFPEVVGMLHVIDLVLPGT